MNSRWISTRGILAGVAIVGLQASALTAQQAPTSAARSDRPDLQGIWRFATLTRDTLVTFLTRELGTGSLDRAKSYMEDPLRMTAHLIMSTPEYQIV